MQEQRLVSRRGARSWRTADGPLVDEAKELIYGQSRTYGYAIVDEAHHFSPMELRMLARRCPSGSMTLLGDLAQAIGPWGLRPWTDLAASVLSYRNVRASRDLRASADLGGIEGSRGQPRMSRVAKMGRAARMCTWSRSATATVRPHRSSTWLLASYRGRTRRQPSHGRQAGPAVTLGTAGGSR